MFKKILMIFFFLDIFVLLATAQEYSLNFCAPNYSCSGNNLCGPNTDYFISTYIISDRSGYLCKNSECVPPLCSSSPFVPDGWAPNCNASMFCSEFKCVDKTEYPVDWNVIRNGKGLHEKCITGSDCFPTLYCNLTTLSCEERLFMEGCPGTCTSSDQCIGGIPCVDGGCREELKQNGEVCTFPSECFSQHCTGGVCGGENCSSIQCPADYYCDRSDENYSQVSCYPVYEKFICDYKTHYPLRISKTFIDCVPKNNSGDCLEDFECTGFCNVAACVNYSRLFIPNGEPCSSVEPSQCVKGHVCVNERCAIIKKLGENCTTTNECTPGLVCTGGIIKQCINSLTLNQPCGWNLQGHHNCSDNEICACLGQTTPSCVDPEGPVYQSKFQSATSIKQYLPELSLNGVNIALKFCKNLATGFDFNNDITSAKIPYSIQKPYLKSKIPQCPTFGDFSTVFQSEGCRKMHAQYFCCSICSLQGYVNSTGISQKDKIFASSFPFIMNPRYKLTCGPNPDFQVVLPNPCELPKPFSWNELVTSINCAANPSAYYIVSFLVNGLPKDHSSTIILKQYFTDFKVLPPVIQESTLYQNNFVVSLYYATSKDAETVQKKINENFNDFMSNLVIGATASPANLTTQLGALRTASAPPPPSPSQGYSLCFSFISFALVIIIIMFQ